MWAQFTLDSLVDTLGKHYLISKVSNDGYYDAVGIYQKPEEVWEEDYGVLAYMTNSMLMAAEPGTYTAQDMYCITRTNYEIGWWINDNGIKYKVHERADVTPYNQTNLYTYKVKREGRQDTSDADVNRQEF